MKLKVVVVVVVETELDVSLLEIVFWGLLDSNSSLTLTVSNLPSLIDLPTKTLQVNFSDALHTSS